jgi:hypothetical protein
MPRRSLLLIVALLALASAHDSVATPYPGAPEQRAASVLASIPCNTVATQGVRYVVVNAAADSCTTAGSETNTCVCDGSNWVVESNSSVDLASATNRPVAWDYIADLTALTLYDSAGASTTYANCPDLFAAAFEPYNVVSGGVSNISANLLIRGSCSATYSQLNPTQYDSNVSDDAGVPVAGAPVTGPYKVFAAMIPTSTYVNSLPVSDGSNASGTSYGLIQWDGVELTFDCDSGTDDQTGNVVMLQLGDAWMVGHQAGNSNQNEYGSFAVGPSQKGKVSLIASDDCDADQPTAGVPLVTGTAAPFTTATTTVQYWQQAYNRSRLDALEVIAKRNSNDHNDLGLFFQANNESSFPRFYASGGGTGVQFSNFNLSSVQNSIATSNDLNIVIGDPTHGSYVTWFANCVDSTRGVDDSTKCGTYNGTVNSLVFNKIDAEASLAGPEITSFGQGTVSFVNSHIEMTPTNLGVEGYVVGAGVCADGTRAGKVATIISQCTGGGTAITCPIEAGFGSSFTSMTFVNTSLGSETNADATGAFGIGECAQAGEINAYGGFWGSSNVSGTPKQFTYNTSGLGAGNRPRFDLSSTVLASDATAPVDYGVVATGNIFQGTTNPSTTYAAQQGDIFQNTTNNELLICKTTDGRCNTAAEWYPVGPKVCNSWTISSPADADDHYLAKALDGITYTDLDCIAEGGGTITLNVQECDGTGASCATLDSGFPITCDSDGSADDGSFSNGAIDAGDWSRALYSAPTGTVSKLTFTLCGYGR